MFNNRLIYTKLNNNIRGYKKCIVKYRNSITREDETITFKKL